MKPNKPSYPYLETFYEVVEYITMFRRDDANANIECEINDTHARGGHCSLYQLAEQWADEFEKLNEGREWDGEFFDEISDFCVNKNKRIFI